MTTVQEKRYGVANKEPFDHKTVQRFAKKVKVLANGCWVWTASLGSEGYGNFNITEDGKKKSIQTHIYSLRLCLPYDQSGLDRHHLCDNRPCVNPSHLTLVTKAHHIKLTPSLIPGIHAKSKTHCLNGHEFTEDNTYVDARGSRHCRMCKLLRKRAYRLRDNPGAKLRRVKED